MVTPDTTELLVIVYAPTAIEARQLERVVGATAERMEQILGGAPVESFSSR
jgi:DNA/RNA-binding domain of Phe-tRNA-synthetase-like protein